MSKQLTTAGAGRLQPEKSRRHPFIIRDHP
jgi:hypothetical protein